jgi:hypothetical protein
MKRFQTLLQNIHTWLTWWQCETFDMVVPMGSFCVTSANLRRFKLQKESLPFDWISGVNLPLAIEWLETAFETFLPAPYSGYLQWVTHGDTHDIYRHEQYPVMFHHDFLTQKNLADFQEVHAKYQRRIQRLLERLNQSKKVLYVHASMEPLTKETYLESWQRLCQIFPHQNIHLAILHLTADSPDVSEDDIHPQIRLVTVPYDQTKDDILGDASVFSPIFKHYRLKRKYLGLFST